MSVSGPDAAKFLQGLVTANLYQPDGAARTNGFYGCFLNAAGRMLHDVFIYPFRGHATAPFDEAGYFIEADAKQVDRLAVYVKRYKLRANLTIRVLDAGEATVWQAWDDVPGFKLSPSTDDYAISLQDLRAPGMGYRILQLNEAVPQLDLERSNEGAYTVRRYLRGVPEGQEETLREKALPLESNLELMKGIDFRKGCYVGQELTIRTKHRGVVRKRILPCLIYDFADEAAPTELKYDAAGPKALTADMIPGETSIGRFRTKGRSAGTWLKGIGNLGLGLCRLESMTDVVLPGELPAATYRPGDEFVLDWGEGDQGHQGHSVKVKAFVPGWLRSGLAEPQH